MHYHSDWLIAKAGMHLLTDLLVLQSSEVLQAWRSATDGAVLRLHPKLCLQGRHLKWRNLMGRHLMERNLVGRHLVGRKLMGKDDILQQHLKMGRAFLLLEKQVVHANTLVW